MDACFKTRDLYLAAYLYSAGKKFIKVENDSGQFITVFEDKSACEKLVRAFWRKEAQVDARGYVDALRTLKDIIFRR